METRRPRLIFDRMDRMGGMGEACRIQLQRIRPTLPDHTESIL